MLTHVNMSGTTYSNPMKITGNIQVLEKCPNLTSVNFRDCKKIEGEHTSNSIS